MMSWEFESWYFGLKKFLYRNDIEICGIVVNSTDKTILVLICYRSPVGIFRNFINNLTLVLDKIVKPEVSIIFTSDFNLETNRDSDRYNIPA